MLESVGDLANPGVRPFRASSGLRLIGAHRSPMTALKVLRTMPDVSPDHFLRMKEVRQRTGLSTSTIYRKIQEGTFPPGHSLGAKARRWLGSEVQSWIDAQLAAEPEVEPWKPPLPPARRIGERKPPPLVPNEKGAEAAAKVAGVVGLAIPEGEAPSDREIALRFPDWPEMMRQRTAAAYLDLSESAFIREVYRGILPNPALLGGRQSWSRQEIDAALARLLKRDGRVR